MAQPPPPPPFEQPNLPNYSQQSSIAEENGHTTWAKRPETFFYNVGTPISQAPDPDPEMAERRDVVKAAMLHSWNGYKKYGWGSDEVSPMARRGKRGAAPGATIIDSMSTLKIMGLEKEFQDAVTWVKGYNFARGGKVSFFETTIRVLGGLLSAYDMTGDKTLLEQATKVGDGLMGAFSQSPVGIPTPEVNLGSGTASAGWTGSNSLLAEMGTIQLEFRQLSHYTGNPRYAQACDKVSHMLEKMNGHNGLWNTYIDRRSGREGSPFLITFGAMSDSAYEYLPKGWIQTGKHEEWLWYASATPPHRFCHTAKHRSVFVVCARVNSPLGSVAGRCGRRRRTRCTSSCCSAPAARRRWSTSPTSRGRGATSTRWTTWPASWPAPSRSASRIGLSKRTFLFRFLLSAKNKLSLAPVRRPDHPNAARDLQTAEDLGDTCVKMYTQQATGVAAEYARFDRPPRCNSARLTLPE